MEEKEASLRKKKLLLQKVLRKLRTLINEAEITSDAGKGVEETVEKMITKNVKKFASQSRYEDQNAENSKISFSQILPISDHRKPETENGDRSYENESRSSSNKEAIPWWDRIMSNRH